MRRADASGTGHAAGVEGPTTAPETVWEFGVPGGDHGYPVVGGDSVYVNGAGTVVSIDPASGTEQWRESSPSSEYTDGIVANEESVIAVSDGVVSLDPSDGTVDWRSEHTYSFDPLVSDGRVYLGWGSSVVSLDPGSGEERWQLDVGESTDHSVDANGWLYVLNRDGVLHAIDTGGTRQWSTNVGSFQTGPCTLGDGRIYCSDEENRRAVAIEAESGETAWEADVYCTSDPTYDGEYVYVSGSTAGVAKIDAVTGDVVDRWYTGDDDDTYITSGSPIVTSDTLIMTQTTPGQEAAPYELVAVETATGRERWRMQLTTGSLAVPSAIVGDRIYCKKSGTIVALAADGE